MHNHYEDGRRCRARATHNNFMCFAHRDAVIPPVIENEPFPIPHLNDRAAIQQALGNPAALLANNRMDLKRAGLLAYILQVASCNLAGTVPSAPAASAQPAEATTTQTRVISTAAQRSGEPPAVLPPANPNQRPLLQPPVILRRSRRISVIVPPPQTLRCPIHTRPHRASVGANTINPPSNPSTCRPSPPQPD
ncbi:MAG TPA: hypothetical protein VHU44_02560 [Acidobacteriaceae bacterium]|nr:hypothetical protein [Acidobacteriaceae bacterium]